jgi:hypothetical protein
MNRTLALGLSIVLAPRAVAAQQTTAWDSVGRVLQTSAVTAGAYRRYTFPRRDLTLRVGDVALSPRLALVGWAGFAGPPQAAVVMGDLVVTESELRGVQATLDSQRLAITAIHTHLIGESPRILYVHVHGEGPAVDLARRLDRALARTSTPRGVALPATAPVSFDTAAIFAALGTPGTASGNVAQLSVVLVTVPVKLHNQALPPALAAGTVVNIQAVSPTRLVATGDFAVTGDRVSTVVGTLATHGITATAVHNHMIGESPPVYFVHFWADGPPADVLGGLKAVLDAARASP